MRCEAQRARAFVGEGRLLSACATSAQTLRVMTDHRPRRCSRYIRKATRWDERPVPPTLEHIAAHTHPPLLLWLLDYSQLYIYIYIDLLLLALLREREKKTVAQIALKQKRVAERERYRSGHSSQNRNTEKNARKKTEETDAQGKPWKVGRGEKRRESKTV